MGLLELMGFRRNRKVTIQELYDKQGDLLRKADEIDEEKDKEKAEKLKKDCFTFLKGLGEEGVDVEFNEEDGKGKITEKRFMSLSIKNIMRNYIVKTINEIEKEIKRREDERRKKRSN